MYRRIGEGNGGACNRYSGGLEKQRRRVQVIRQYFQDL